MTVQLVNDSRQFLMKSSDTKPVHLSGVGAKLTVTDTGEKYIWDGDGWELDQELIFAVKTALEEAT